MSSRDDVHRSHTVGHRGPRGAPADRGTGRRRLHSAPPRPAIPIVAFGVPVAHVQLPADENANRFMVVGVALVVGVGGVFFLYWGMNRVVDFLPERVREGVRPYVFVGPVPGDPCSLPGLSRHQHDPDQPQGRRVPRGSWAWTTSGLCSPTTTCSPGDPQHGRLDRPGAAVQRDDRAGLRHACRSAQDRRGESRSR